MLGISTRPQFGPGVLSRMVVAFANMAVSIGLRAPFSECPHHKSPAI